MNINILVVMVYCGFARCYHWGKCVKNTQNTSVLFLTTACNLQLTLKQSLVLKTSPKNFTICMEIQETSNSQSNLEKEEWNWRNQPAWLQTIVQSHSHQDSMVLAQRQKYRSMEQNRKPRDKSMYLWTPYLRQRRQEYTMEKRQPF